MKLFIDDIRKPFWLYNDFDEWELVKNMDEMISFIKERGIPEMISFDNDLGIDDNGNILPDGYSCLNYLIENDIYIKGIVVHSDNVVANEQIYGKSKNWHKFLIGEEILKEEDVFVLKRPALHNLTLEYKKRN